MRQHGRKIKENSRLRNAGGRLGNRSRLSLTEEQDTGSRITNNKTGTRDTKLNGQTVPVYICSNHAQEWAPYSRSCPVYDCRGEPHREAYEAWG